MIYKMRRFCGKKFRVSADFFKDHVPHTFCFFGFSLVQSMRFLHIKNGAGARIFKEYTHNRFEFLSVTDVSDNDGLLKFTQNRFQYI